MPRPESPALTVPERALPTEVINALNKAVQQLSYGLVQLIIHDGRVVQLDVTERHRF